MTDKKLQKLLRNHLKLSDHEVHEIENNDAWKLIDQSQKSKNKICFAGFDENNSAMFKALSKIYGFMSTDKPDDNTRYLCVGNDAEISLIKTALEKGVIVISDDELEIILGTYHENKVEKYFCFVGIFNGSRTYLKKRVEIAGGLYETSVSKNTDYLVVGNNSGEGKIRRALSCYTEIINEDRLYELLKI